MENRIKGAVVAGAGVVAAVESASVAAQDDLAAAGNGGFAEAAANGSAVIIDDVVSGLNSGAVIGAGDVYDGSLAIDGGSVTSSTTLDLSANGGVAVADASGGDENDAATIDVNNNNFFFVS